MNKNTCTRPCFVLCSVCRLLFLTRSLSVRSVLCDECFSLLPQSLNIYHTPWIHFIVRIWTYGNHLPITLTFLISFLYWGEITIVFRNTYTTYTHIGIPHTSAIDNRCSGECYQSIRRSMETCSNGSTNSLVIKHFHRPYMKNIIEFLVRTNNKIMWMHQQKHHVFEEISNRPWVIDLSAMSATIRSALLAPYREHCMLRESSGFVSLTSFFIASTQPFDTWRAYIYKHKIFGRPICLCRSR